MFVSYRLIFVFIISLFFQDSPTEGLTRKDNVCSTFSLASALASDLPEEDSPTPYSNNSSSSICRPIEASPEECLYADYQYGTTKQTPPSLATCRPLNGYQTIAQLCSFQKINSAVDVDVDYKVICDVTPCNGGTIRIGFFKHETGFIGFPESSTMKTNAVLEREIWKLYKRNVDEVNFCILACFSNPNFIKQALVFPPRFKTAETRDHQPNKLNINILLLDSVSRQHFYRKLPATVNALKNIKQTQETSILDFELFQSIAPRTFPNIRALFSGKVDIDSDDESHEYNLENLTGHFRELGYQNIIQEDSCWFDVWGSLITNNRHSENVAQNWGSVRGVIKQLPIDSLGVSHFSCEAFQQYGKTNQFNNPPKVCYNGHLLPSYYLNYTYQHFRDLELKFAVRQNKRRSQPTFMYTHLNTAHESTGKRVAQMDYLLADFVEKVSRFKNTLTIIMSDHGPKTTKYAQQHLSGRLEIGHAFMFMLLPNMVKEFLGVDRVRALTQNQKTLIGPLDLHFALKSLHSMPTDKGSGLLSPLGKTRFCNHVPMYSFMNCLCNGGTQLITEPEQFHWMVEFVVGHLNELITSSLLAAGAKNGYGNCERLIGSQYNKIRRKTSRQGYEYFVIDILVHKYRGEEIFEVVVRLRQDSVTFDIEVVKWRRVSIYQHFSKCCDHPVDIQLCICRRETQNVPNPGRDLSRQLSIPSFGRNTESAFLDSRCLLLMKREKTNLFRTYEITNMCLDRIYHTNFTIDGNIKVRSAIDVPISTTVRPWFIYHITTISLDEESESPQETIAFKIESL